MVRNLFQVKDINMSYRMRGYEARIQRNEKAMAMNLSIMAMPVEEVRAPRKRTAESILISKILAYSAMNRSANSPLPYSILNPETSSDSPSARSKGARLVSAKLEINHIMATGIRGRANQKGVWESAIEGKWKVNLEAKITIRIKAILIS